uniref:Uncharacterized protein n=1 Tax=Ascaris lumbricoides TaxID=6252 RepID=A0A0M3INY8_ASCLU
MMRPQITEYLIDMLGDEIYYDEANPKYRCLWNRFHSVVFCTLLCIMFALSVFAVCVVDYNTFLVFIGRTDIKTFAGKIGLIIFVKIIIVVVAIFVFWQSRVVSACRQFYHDKTEQNQYLHTAIPDDLPAADEKPPVQSLQKLAPQYLPFTLQ